MTSASELMKKHRAYLTRKLSAEANLSYAFNDLLPGFNIDFKFSKPGASNGETRLNVTEIPFKLSSSPFEIHCGGSDLIDRNTGVEFEPPLPTVPDQVLPEYKDFIGQLIDIVNLTVMYFHELTEGEIYDSWTLSFIDAAVTESVVELSDLEINLAQQRIEFSNI